MTTPFMRASMDVLWSGLSQAAGVTVTYTHTGLGITYPVTAVPGRTDIEADQGDGVLRTTRLHDFSIMMDDLQVQPEAGDVITWDQRNYEVNNPASDRYAVEMGPYQQMWRIHTVEVYGS